MQLVTIDWLFVVGSILYSNVVSAAVLGAVSAASFFVLYKLWDKVNAS